MGDGECPHPRRSLVAAGPRGPRDPEHTGLGRCLRRRACAAHSGDRVLLRRAAPVLHRQAVSGVRLRRVGDDASLRPRSRLPHGRAGRPGAVARCGCRCPHRGSTVAQRLLATGGSRKVAGHDGDVPLVGGRAAARQRAPRVAHPPAVGRAARAAVLRPVAPLAVHHRYRGWALRPGGICTAGQQPAGGTHADRRSRSQHGNGSVDHGIDRHPDAVDVCGRQLPRRHRRRQR